MPRRAGAPLAQPIDEPLDPAILQAVEGDQNQPAAGPQQGGRRLEQPLDLAQLVIDRDAQRLEHLGCRRAAGLAAALGAGDHGGEVGGGGDRLLGASGDDGPGDAPGLRLVAEVEEELGERLLVQPGDELRGRLADAAHPHVERAGRLEREASRRGIELKGGDAEIGDDAVHRGKAAVTQVPGNIAEGAFEHDEARLGGGKGPAPSDRFRVTIEPDDAARSCVENGPAVAAAAEGHVENGLACGRRQGLQHRVEQDGRMAHTATPFHKPQK